MVSAHCGNVVVGASAAAPNLLPRRRPKLAACERGGQLEPAKGQRRATSVRAMNDKRPIYSPKAGYALRGIEGEGIRNTKHTQQSQRHEWGFVDFASLRAFRVPRSPLAGAGALEAEAGSAYTGVSRSSHTARFRRAGRTSGEASARACHGARQGWLLDRDHAAGGAGLSLLLAARGRRCRPKPSAGHAADKPAPALGAALHLLPTGRGGEGEDSQALDGLRC